MKLKKKKRYNTPLVSQTVTLIGKKLVILSDITCRCSMINSKQHGILVEKVQYFHPFTLQILRCIILNGMFTVLYIFEKG